MAQSQVGQSLSDNVCCVDAPYIEGVSYSGKTNATNCNSTSPYNKSDNRAINNSPIVPE